MKNGVQNIKKINYSDEYAFLRGQDDYNRLATISDDDLRLLHQNPFPSYMKQANDWEEGFLYQRAINLKKIH